MVIRIECGRSPNRIGIYWQADSESRADAASHRHRRAKARMHKLFGRHGRAKVEGAVTGK